MPIEWLIIVWLYGVGAAIVAGVARHADPAADARHVWLIALLWPVFTSAVYVWRKIKRG